MEEILNAIPHRPPFLFVDRIVELGATKIKTSKEIKPDEPVFAGHYPGQPIMPGALICESIFQTGAILLSKIMGGMGEGIPVLTRINNAKFKSIVRPEATTLRVRLRRSPTAERAWDFVVEADGTTACTGSLLV